MDLITTGKRAYRKVRYVQDLLRTERQGLKKSPIPLHKRARVWRHGFLGESYALYDLSRNDWRQYLPDTAYYLRTPFINYGRYNAILNDKILFYYAMKSMAASTPPVYGFVRGARIAWIDPPAGVDGPSGLSTLLEQGRELVLKPGEGGGGGGVSFVTKVDGSVTVNGQESDMAAVKALLVPGTLISERVHQATYADRINAEATNTIRIVTMLDHRDDEPFLAWVVHRFATRRSLPVDNFGQGGLSAAVDLETGELGRAASFPYTGRLEWHSVHPDTGAQIAGAVITDWPRVRERILDVARRLPQLPLVGWDVVAQDDGLSILEGNSYPNPRTVQVHQPLLADPRVRDFYRHHRIVRERAGS